MNRSKYLKYSKKIKLLQKGGGKCMVCMERAANIVAKPCNHAILCKLCASEFILDKKKCPICNIEFETIETIQDDAAYFFIEKNTVNIPHCEPFLGTIDFLVYYVLQNNYLDVFDSDTITPDDIDMYGERLFNMLSSMFPNVTRNISNIDEFKQYLVFVIENEIWNRKNVIQYDDSEEVHKERMKAELYEKSREKFNDVFLPLFKENLDRLNILCKRDILGYIQQIVDQKLSQKRLVEEKRDAVMARLAQIQDQIDQIREPIKTKLISRYLSGIDPRGILDTKLDETISNLDNDMIAIRNLVTMFFFRRPLMRTDLNLLFENLQRHTRDIKQLNWLQKINITPIMNDRDVASLIHTIFDEIIKTP
jgi:hypothetical protein